MGGRKSTEPSALGPEELEITMKTHFNLVIILAVCLVPGVALCGSGPNPAPAAPPSPAEDGTMPALTAIAGQGMMDTHAYDELEDLSDNIGGRLTGSPQAAKAIEWGQARMRAIGLSNVHAEKWQLSHGWTRLSAIAELTEPLCPSERQAYQEAIRLHLPHMDFAPDSNVPAAAQTKILQLLASLAQPSMPQIAPSAVPAAPTRKSQPARKLSLFELSRLRRELQSATSTASAPELLRQVVWSIEAGSLRRFETRHALHIALKKIREGLWTRPNRMPPNWARTLSTPSPLETCGHA